MCATSAFIGLGAHVTVIDKDVNVLQRVYNRFSGVVTMISTKRNIERAIAYADVVVGAVLITGERTPILITREMMQEAAPRPRVPRRTITQPSSKRACCIIASPTCPAWSRGPPPMHLSTQPCPIFWKSRTLGLRKQ
jgi:hypothetical protein